MGTYMELRSAELLVEYMKHRNDMKTTELARYADVSKQFISRLRCGHDKTCKPETAERIERALGVPLGALFVEKISTTGGQIPAQQRRTA